MHVLQFIFSSFGIVVPKGNNYAEIPTDGNDIKVQIKDVDTNGSFIAPWNYCQENKDKWDYVDSVETLRNDSIPCKFLMFNGCFTIKYTNHVFG